jgi:hypothetical protein
MSSGLFYGATTNEVIPNLGCERMITSTRDDFDNKDHELEIDKDNGFLPMASLFYAAQTREGEEREREPDEDASSRYRWSVHHRDWCLRTDLLEYNAQSKGCAGRQQEHQR